MWTRKELKNKAKDALKRNYWKAVLVALLMSILGGGFAPAAASSRVDGEQDAIITETIVTETDVAETTAFLAEDKTVSIFTDAAAAGENVVDSIDGAVRDALKDLEQAEAAVMIALAVVFFAAFLVAMACAFLADIFLINPLWVGAQRFMLKSTAGAADIAELGYGFDHAYLNNVKTAFHRDLQIFLWSLLFLVPGIYKKYQYYMVDYILAENPGMPYKEVLNRSKEMMDGQKWNAFVLDLSFLLWHMLSMFTCGILEVLYVKPYQYLTRASLYRTLHGKEQLTVVEENC